MTRETRNHLVWMCLLWVVFTAIGEILVQWAIASWPLIASVQGEVTGEAIFFLMRAVVPIFVLVTLIVVYSMIRFRVPEDDTQPAEAQYRTGHAFVYTWVAASVAINILFIFHPGISGLTSLWGEAQAATAGDPLEVDVAAKQWQWDFKYPKSGVTKVDNLVVPVGKPVKFVLKSDDVIHSFWVPAWGIKKAVIPGETRTLVVTPTKQITTAQDPTARVQCAQICGIGHPLMRGGLKAVSADAFAKWIADNKPKPSDNSGMQMNMSGSGNGASGGMSGMSGSGDGGSSGNSGSASGSGGSSSGNGSGGSSTMDMNGSGSASGGSAQ